MPDKKLSVVPDSVKLRCGFSTKVRVYTSDRAKKVSIDYLGYDSSVAKVTPENGKTGDDGYLEVYIECGQPGFCPGTTTVTFDAKGYDTTELGITCEKAPFDSRVQVTKFEGPVDEVSAILKNLDDKTECSECG